MSKKNLLNESTIRKFMKLASIEPLASDFLGRIQESDEELEEGRDKEEVDEAKHDDDLEEGRDKDDDLEEGRDKDDMDEAAHDEDLDERGDMMFKDDEEEVDMGMGMGDEAGGKMVDVDAFISALESALETAMGEPAEVEYEEDDMEMDMEEPEGEMEMDVELDADEEEEEEEDLAETIYKEVLKRISEKK